MTDVRAAFADAVHHRRFDDAMTLLSSIHDPFADPTGDGGAVLVSPILTITTADADGLLRVVLMRTRPDDHRLRTVLFDAAAGGAERCVAALLAHGVPPDPAGTADPTPLIAAAAAAHPACVALLLDAGADPRRRSTGHGSCATALHAAGGGSRNRSNDDLPDRVDLTVVLLVAAGADLAAPDGSPEQRPPLLWTAGARWAAARLLAAGAPIPSCRNLGWGFVCCMETVPGWRAACAHAILREEYGHNEPPAAFTPAPCPADAAWLAEQAVLRGHPPWAMRAYAACAGPSDAPQHMY